VIATAAVAAAAVGEFRPGTRRNETPRNAPGPMRSEGRRAKGLGAWRDPRREDRKMAGARKRKEARRQ